MILNTYQETEIRHLLFHKISMFGEQSNGIDSYHCLGFFMEMGGYFVNYTFECFMEVGVQLVNMALQARYIASFSECHERASKNLSLLLTTSAELPGVPTTLTFIQPPTI